LHCSFTQFKQAVFHLAFSPDGRHLAVAAMDNEGFVLVIVDVRKGQVVAMYRDREIFATAFHPDGQWLAVGLMDGNVKLVKPRSAESPTVVELGRHDLDLVMRGVAFRPNGQHLASASRDGKVKVWELASILKTPENPAETRVPRQPHAGDSVRHPMEFGHSGIALWSLVYSSDGRHILTGSIDGQLTRWDADTGKLLDQRIEASSGGFLSVACSPGGRWIVSASEDCTIRVYDAPRMELVHQFRGHLAPIHCVAASDQYVVTGGADMTVKVWDLRSLDQKLSPSR
jgi:hypothetical protein